MKEPIWRSFSGPFRTLNTRPGLRIPNFILPSPFHPSKSNSRIPLFRLHRPQQRFYRRRAFNANRFQSTQNLFHRWSSRPTFYYECAGLGGTCAALYILNLTEVPVTHRRQFNIIPESYMAQQAQQLYHETLQQHRHQLLPAHDPRHQACRRVLDRLLPHSSGLSSSPEPARWALHVIDDPALVNAFVLPGGRVFVGTGMLRVCAGDEAALAAVLAHEIAHDVAAHSAERLSRYGIFLGVAALATLAFGFGDYLNLTRVLVDLAVMRPGSRAQESEADHIGLLMMASACYEPAAAARLWETMDRMAGAAPPQWLSTHPSNRSRRDAIWGWMGAAEAKREESGCGRTADWASGFYRMNGRLDGT